MNVELEKKADYILQGKAAPTFALENSLLQYYKTEVWQILRYHSSRFKINLEFTPHYGVALWHCNLLYNGDVIESTIGINLWKRFRLVYLKMKEFVGEENLYQYEKYKSII